MKHLHEETLESEQVFRGKLLDIRRDRVRLPDGSEGVRECIVHPGAVVVIPVLANGDLLFERQFRYPVGHAFLELPAGKIDAGEDIAVTARRELLEETGHEADDWRHLGAMHPCIGYSNERIEIFLARGLRPGFSAATRPWRVSRHTVHVAGRCHRGDRENDHRSRKTNPTKCARRPCRSTDSGGAAVLADHRVVAAFAAQLAGGGLGRTVLKAPPALRGCPSAAAGSRFRRGCRAWRSGG
jgi:hypothetical protein